MNLLQEGIEQRAVIKTALTKKMTVDGITKAYPVYKVRLDWLFYNDQNDRIATWISQYKFEHDGLIPDINDKVSYNNIIEGFVVASNPDAIRKTQTNIEIVDQREPGVVLSDGRIIDGNRRFTCLRRLAQKNDRFNYFETVILDRNIDNSAKQIKMLELSIQHGEESKVDYDPVDKLVGIYNDIVDTHLLSIEEYAKSTNESETKVRNYMELSKLMVEFLEFINAPKQFHIARDMQVTFPLNELLKLTKKCHDNNEAEDLKITVFNNMLMHTSTDMTHFVRNFKSIIGSPYQEEFLSEQKNLAEKVIQTLPPVGKVTTEVIRESIRNQPEITEAMNQSVEKTIILTKKMETRNRPIYLAEKAANFLDNIDVNILLKLDNNELQQLLNQLSNLEEAIVRIRKNI